MTDSIPKSIRHENIEFLGYPFTLHTLDNGVKVFEEGDMTVFMRALSDGTVNPTKEDIATLNQYLKEETL